MLQNNATFFFTRLWSVRKALISDTHYPVISGFSIAHAYKYKTKRQAKMKRRQKKKNDIFVVISHQSTHVPKSTDHTDVQTSEGNHDIVLFCNSHESFLLSIC